MAAIIGCAETNAAAVKIVSELRKRNVLCFLSGNIDGRSIIHQLQDEGLELGYDTGIVPLGTDTVSAIHSLGFATRWAIAFGGLKPGMRREILDYCKSRLFGFVLTLGEIDDRKAATAAGAMSFGFPLISDSAISDVPSTTTTIHEQTPSMGVSQIDGKDDLERAECLAEKCIEVRGLKVRLSRSMYRSRTVWPLPMRS